MKVRTVLLIGAGAVVAAALLIFIFRKPGGESMSQDAILTDVPVTVTPVARQKLASSLSLVGTINASNDVNVVSETQGVAKEVYVRVGDKVAGGTVLVQVDDEIPRSNLAAAEINHTKALRDFERSEALYQENSISVSQLDAARLGLKASENQLDIVRRQLANTKIKSPIGGTVNARFVNVGTMISPGMTVANVVDVRTLKVNVNVNEHDAFQLTVGDTVAITTDVYPGVTFPGTIGNVASKADAAHTYAVEINVANPPKSPLKAGMFARVSFTSLQPTESLVIPRLSLIGSIKDAQVFVVRAGAAELRKVVIGKQSAALLEVLQGLRQGDSVVTAGQNNLVGGMRVLVMRDQEHEL